MPHGLLENDPIPHPFIYTSSGCSSSPLPVSPLFLCSHTSSASPSFLTGFSCISRIFSTCRSSARLSLFLIYRTQADFILLLLILRPFLPLLVRLNVLPLVCALESTHTPAHFPRVAAAGWQICRVESGFRPFSSPCLSLSAVHSIPGARCCIPTETCTAFCHK